MRVYVDLIYTIAVEVDHAEYDASTDDELLEAARRDPDFAIDGRLHNGPHAIYDNDWRIPYLYRAQAEALTPDGFEVEVRRAVAAGGLTEPGEQQ